MSQYERIEDDPARAGFQRFTSLDPRFPIAISWPQLGGTVFYDMNNEAELDLQCQEDGSIRLHVMRDDLQILAERGFPVAQEVVNGRKDMAWYAKETFEHWKRSGYSSVDRYRLIERERDMLAIGSGTAAFHAPTLLWQTRTGKEGARVFFTRNASDVRSKHPSSWDLWFITLHPRTILRPHLQTILASFQWL